MEKRKVRKRGKLGRKRKKKKKMITIMIKKGKNEKKKKKERKKAKWFLWKSGPPNEKMKLFPVTTTTRAAYVAGTTCLGDPPVPCLDVMAM